MKPEMQYSKDAQ